MNLTDWFGIEDSHLSADVIYQSSFIPRSLLLKLQSVFLPEGEAKVK